jgi:hypothetical protein
MRFYTTLAMLLLGLLLRYGPLLDLLLRYEVVGLSL